MGSIKNLDYQNKEYSTFFIKMITYTIIVSMIVAILVFAFLALMYGPQLLNYIPSGDDLVYMSIAPHSFTDIVRLFSTFGTQYRPVTQSLFWIYRSLLPYFSMMFFINLVLFSVVIALLYYNLRRFISTKKALIISLAVSLSPIFYYHVFALSALNNTLILISNLFLLLLIDFENKSLEYVDSRKSLHIAACVLLLSAFIKETFILNIFLFAVIAWQKAGSKKWWWIGATIITSVIFLSLHVILYPSFDPNYAIVLSSQKFVENALLIGSWLVAYPRGWQYGAPEPKSILTFIITLSMCMSFMVAYISAFLEKKSFMLFFSQGHFFFSTLPYFFLQRVLVYYVDAAFVILVLMLGRMMRTKTQKSALIFGSLFCVTSLIHFLIIYPQWQQYSFVARSNMAARNYMQEISKLDLSKYRNLCIVNHTEGTWGTHNGNLVTYATGSPIHVISTPSQDIPNDCLDNSVILRNDGIDYSTLLDR